MSGMLGYYLIIAAVYTLMSHSEYMIRYRKYIFGALLLSGGILIAVFFFSKHEYTIALFSGVLALFGLTPFIQKLRGKDDPAEVIDLPAKSYQIRSLEELEGGQLHLRYILCHEDQQYYLSTIPSAGEPAVRLIVHKVPGQKIRSADLIETGKNRTFRGIMNSIDKLIGFIAAVLLPFSFIGDRASYTLFSMLLTLTVSSVICTVTANSRQAFGRIIHWIGRICMIAAAAAAVLALIS